MSSPARTPWSLAARPTGFAAHDQRDPAVVSVTPDHTQNIGQTRLEPHQTESFKLSPDPQFIDKVRDLVELYLNPPDAAVVMCVDEKSQIQALDRSAPVLPLMPGSPSATPTTTCAAAPRTSTPRSTWPPAR